MEDALGPRGVGAPMARPDDERVCPRVDVCRVPIDDAMDMLVASRSGWLGGRRLEGSHEARPNARHSAARRRRSVGSTAASRRHRSGPRRLRSSRGRPRGSTLDLALELKGEDGPYLLSERLVAGKPRCSPSTTSAGGSAISSFG